jgi:cobalamin biosynthesis protein CobW
VDAQRRADENLDHESPLHELFEDQLSAADLVVLGKADLVDEAQLAQVEALVRAEVPPEVKIVRAARGELPLAVLLGQGKAAEDHIESRHSHHDHEEDHDHDEFDSLDLDLGEQEPQLLLAKLAEVVKAHDVLRVKGFVAVPNKPMRLLVQGVGKRIDHYFDRAWTSADRRTTRLVFIGRDLDGAALKAALQ